MLILKQLDESEVEKLGGIYEWKPCYKASGCDAYLSSQTEMKNKRTYGVGLFEAS